MKMQPMKNSQYKKLATLDSVNVFLHAALWLRDWIVEAQARAERISWCALGAKNFDAEKNYSEIFRPKNFVKLNEIISSSKNFVREKFRPGTILQESQFNLPIEYIALVTKSLIVSS
jgi:hypothetical protein